MTDTITRPTLAEALAANPTSALEDIARAAGVTPLDVLLALPAGEVTALSGKARDRFRAVNGCGGRG